MTVEEFLRQVVREVGEVYSDATVEALFLNWLVNGISELELEADAWNFSRQVTTFDTVVGTSIYSLGSNILDVYRIGTADGTLLRTTTIKELSSRGFSLDQSGTPLYVVRYGYIGNEYKIRLFPTPSAVTTYTVWYNVDPVAVSSSDTLNFPGPVLVALRHYVISEFYTQAERLDLATAYRGKYLTAISKLRQRLSYDGSRDLVLHYTDVPGETAQEPNVLWPEGY